MPDDKEYSEPPHRKLTTILAADVVGYSRMMNVDEDGALYLSSTLNSSLTKKTS